MDLLVFILLFNVARYVIFLLISIVSCIYLVLVFRMAMLMIGAERRVKDVRRELIYMRAFLKDIGSAGQVEVEDYDEWLDHLNDVALNAEDVLETFFDKTVRRTWIFYLGERMKLNMELDGIINKMRKLWERRMKYDQIHRSTNAESQPETSGNKRVFPAVEKLSYILNENLVAGSELKKMVQEVRVEVVSMVNVVSDLESKKKSSEREKVWLKEASNVCNFTAKVIDDFITRRARAWFWTYMLMHSLGHPASSEKKLMKEMMYIKTQVRGALFRRLTYGVGEEDVRDETGFSYGFRKRGFNKIIGVASTVYLYITGRIPTSVILISIFYYFANKTVDDMMSVDKRLESIKRELALIRAFFKDIRSAEGLNKRQQVWMKQIIKVAQQAQDFLGAYERRMNQSNVLFKHIVPPLKFDKEINYILNKIHNIWERKTFYDIDKIEGSMLGSDSEIQIVVEHNDNSGTEEDPLLPAGMTNSSWLVEDIPNTAVGVVLEELQLMNALFRDVEEMGEPDGRSKIWLEQMRENTRELESIRDEYASKVEDKTFNISIYFALIGIQLKINQTRSSILETSRLRKRYGFRLQARVEPPSVVRIDNMPQYLMRCLSYFVLFPATFEIPARRLIVLWVAQGLVRYEQGSPEKAAESYLKELIDRRMVQIVKKKRNGKVKTCCLHNSLRGSPSFLPDLKIHSTDSDLMADHHDANDKWYNDIHGDTITASADLKKLYKDVRSFLSFDTQNGSKPGQDIGQFLNRCISSGGFVLLRVLDLERVYKPQLPENIASLSRLRYLGLRWTYLESLPSSISSLLYLQTLDLKHTYINILTSSIWKMQLRHLFLSEAYRTRFPPHPRRKYLSELQTLWGLFVDEKTQVKGGLDRLVNITKLRLACQSMSPDEKDMESQLKAVAEWIVNLKDLQTLRVKSRKEDGEPGDLHLKSLENHELLTDMYLLGILKSPSIKSLFPKSLIDLTLSHSELKQDSIEILGDLPELQSLCLFAGSYIEETLLCKRGSFPKLHVLKIWKLEQLLEWNIEDEAFPHLRELEIRSCKCLHMLPDGLEHVNALLELKSTTMSENLMGRVRRGKVPISCKVFYCYIKEGAGQLTCEPSFLRNAYWKSNQLDPLKC